MLDVLITNLQIVLGFGLVTKAVCLLAGGF